jgi:hypothetical protein
MPNGDDLPPQPFQYSLRAMFALTTAVAVVASMAATFGRRVVVWSVPLLVCWIIGWFSTGRPWQKGVSLRARIAWPIVFDVVLLLVTLPVCRTWYGLYSEQFRDVRDSGLTATLVWLSLLSLALNGVVRRWRQLTRQDRRLVVFALSLPIAYVACIHGFSARDMVVDVRGVVASRAVITALMILVVLSPIMIGSLCIPRLLRCGLYAAAVSVFLFWITILGYVLQV